MMIKVICRQPGLLQMTILLGMILVLSGCAPVLNNTRFIKPGEAILKADSTINGLRRTAMVYIPQSYSSQHDYPLVVVIHGAFSNAERMAKETGFNRLADREGVVVVYPNGMGLFGFLQHWNAGHCCGRAVRDQLGDVEFITEIIEKLSEKIHIDNRKIYLVGFSNGGMMAHRFAAEKSSVVAAFASLAASAGGREDISVPLWLPPQPSVPVPALLIHGLNDTTVPAGGGRSSKKSGGREYLSLQQSTRFWLQANACSDSFDKTGFDKIVIRKWKNCRGNSSVLQITLAEWGHRWPGPYYFRGSSDYGGFDAAEEIWRFFQQHERGNFQD